MKNTDPTTLILGVASPLSLGLLAAARGAWHARRHRQQTDEVWHREQVEMFLHCAEDDDYSFKGFEWADFASNTDREVVAATEEDDAAAAAPVSGANPHFSFPPTFEPPFVRLRCLSCQDEWDVWIDDDGKPEDARDLRCDCGNDCDLIVVD